MALVQRPVPAMAPWLWRIDRRVACLSRGVQLDTAHITAARGRVCWQRTRHSFLTGLRCRPRQVGSGVAEKTFWGS